MILSEINVKQSETLATLGTQDTGQRQTKQKNTTQHRKLRILATQIPPKSQVLVKGKLKFVQKTYFNILILSLKTSMLGMSTGGHLNTV